MELRVVRVLMIQLGFDLVFQLAFDLVFQLVFDLVPRHVLCGHMQRLIRAPS